MRPKKYFYYILSATILELCIFLFINSTLYRGVFNLGLLIPFMMFRVLASYYYSKQEMRNKRAKPTLVILFTIPLLLFIFFKPTYTFEQARQLVYESAYDVSHIVVHNEERRYRDTVPIYTEDSRCFISYRDYHFEGDGRYFLVHPRSGVVTEMKQPYW
ncbi:hypothetical protein GJU40_14965 [Bacillus lacus]|uniref:Uncharacterized protein n=1 Tax=Metabacillus lacus TaxID=1983721 RepID=A0A7X2M0Y6_9BACI|nr:hypothetical protein [Metabacillus lacus]MRX73444.1 hypothetical protein [Metabacillus lacus]